ncbi:MAG: nucleoside triphosphate pyrophosphohydrolase, partial [Clostridia bacterium]|nr:nucleoside triphosphate pyrophosphohydrolase [Clostridia bacterium]
MNEQAYIAWRDEKITELLSQSSYNFEDLCDVVTILRGVGGCPWDREQDHHSIRKGLIEECYEVVEAIDRDDAELLREELGDVLLQIVFHSDMEKDAGHFDINDVANDECVKMIHRHPHVFGQVKADTSEQVLANWEVI